MAPTLPEWACMVKNKVLRLFQEPNQQQYDEFEFTNKSHLEKSSIPYKEDYSGADGELGLQSPTESLPSPVRPPLRHIDRYIKPEIPNLSKRYTIAILTCIGFMISFGMRCNMPMAKLKFHIGPDEAPPSEVMHLNTTTTTTVHPPLPKNTPIHERPINWTLGSFVAIETSFFCGYLITQVPGGFLASMYPANKVFGIAIAMSAVLNMLIPSATEVHKSSYVIFIRTVQGLIEGVTYPACHGIWRYWAPPMERSRLATIALCGSYAGVVVGMPLSGTLIDWFSWEAPFYAYGVMGMIWYVFWMWLTFEKPSLHPTISARELNHIEKSLGSVKQSAPPTLTNTPWREFFHSMPVYAIIVANFCRSWNFYLLVLFQASYLHSFNFEVSETGYIGALPHLLMTIVVPLGGLLADHLRKNGILSTTAVRKLFNCGGFGMEATFFLLLATADTALTATIALTCGVAFSGFAISGFNVNHLDIAPRYASILMGISNGIGTIAGLLCPGTINLIISHKTKQSWSEVFILAAAIHFVGVIFYGIFASGELQPWAEPKVEEDQQMDEVSLEKKKPPSYGSIEQSSQGYTNAGLKVGSAELEPTPPTVNPTNPFLAKPTVTNPFKSEQ
ncbi:vesicular glutamate transporter 1 [Adelges cooleyi]|uniref:vesicular glutamate transporter 1 n=1 Tax=Adelges cooleyi TaxID=133065 RepID=UPI00217FE40C|nr:vesicular glutamate transporter 1 [Adelges cooleyi]XP_050441336.1 vesicular glutamate transporter 1 [Adelges cooleyi]